MMVQVGPDLLIPPLYNSHICYPCTHPHFAPRQQTPRWRRTKGLKWERWGESDPNVTCCTSCPVFLRSNCFFSSPPRPLSTRPVAPGPASSPPKYLSGIGKQAQWETNSFPPIPSFVPQLFAAKTREARCRRTCSLQLQSAWECCTEQGLEALHTCGRSESTYYSSEATDLQLRRRATRAPFLRRPLFRISWATLAPLYSQWQGGIRVLRSPLTRYVQMKLSNTFFLVADSLGIPPATPYVKTRLPFLAMRASAMSDWAVKTDMTRLFWSVAEYLAVL